MGRVSWLLGVLLGVDGPGGSGISVVVVVCCLSRTTIDRIIMTENLLRVFSHCWKNCHQGCQQDGRCTHIV